MTKIPWTDETWNPVVGCTKIATGCENCYAEKFSWRLACMGKAYHNAVCDKDGWNGNVLCREDVLEKPLHWRDPRKIFVCSMSDLFHDKVPFEFIDKVHAVAALCPQHTFQILTKRIERAGEYYTELEYDYTEYPDQFYDIVYNTDWNIKKLEALEDDEERFDREYDKLRDIAYPSWPLPNLWLGTSISTQADADKNIPILLQIPAAVRFLSVEPMLERIDLWHGTPGWEQCSCGKIHKMPKVGHARCDCVFFQHERFNLSELFPLVRNLDWVIIGCESGPKRRPCKLEWVEDLIGQCDGSDGVPVFVKQLEIDGKLSRNPKEWPKWAQRKDYPTRKNIQLL